MDIHIMPMMTEHANISTGNRRRFWPGAPIDLTDSASQSPMEVPHAAAASYVNKYVFELSEFKYLDEPTTTSSPLVYNVRGIVSRGGTEPTNYSLRTCPLQDL